MRKTARLGAAIASALFLLGPVMAGTFASLESPGAYELQSVGFELSREIEIDIEAVGIGRKDAQGGRGGSWFGRNDAEPFLVFAWLLDSETRDAVWTMRYRDTESEDEGLRRAETSVRLGPGRYELYLFSALGRLAGRAERDQDASWWERMIEGLGMSGRELEQALDSCFVKLASSGLGPQEVTRFEVDGGLTHALVRLNQIGDSQFAAGGFELDRRSELRVYALIEKSERRGQAADYGWIVDEATREVVWSAADAWFEPAGGAEKNRLVDDEITLAAGRYLAFYGSDDSHSFDEFNSAAPRDPLNWGLTVLPGKDLDPTTARSFKPTVEEPLLEMSRAGDDELLEQAFRLNRDGTLHVQALGEYGDDDLFYDRGWIVEASSGETVWEMTDLNTVGAGGANKNRRFDGLIELPVGEYVLYYASDDSHSYDGWNGAAPFQPERWGVALWPGPEFDRAEFRQIDRDELLAASGVLAQIVRVGDDERRREPFRVDREMRVRIYGVGEGDGDRMYDYGYILDEAGRKVWQMSRDNTRHAGGADKNVVADDELTLEPGEYVVVYRSDGSHSFGGWNAAPPRDPSGWGLTVRELRR